jgi:hypothetical protein
LRVAAGEVVVEVSLHAELEADARGLEADLLPVVAPERVEKPRGDGAGEQTEQDRGGCLTV